MVEEPEDIVVIIRFNGRCGDKKAGEVSEHLSSEFPEIPLIIENVMVFKLAED